MISQRLPQTPPPTIDFSVIDLPAEALVMPGLDLFVNLTAGDAVDGTVTVELGGKQLDYTWKGLQCSGHVGEENIELKPNDCHSAIEGHVGGNALTVSQDGMPGLIMASGQVANLEFVEQMALDPAFPLTGHYANLSGNIGTQSLQADIFRTHDGYRLCGHLGGSEIHQTLVLGHHGGVIDGHIGQFPIHQVVTTTP